MRKPELVAPAGDFEKLKFAVAYGADAVYLGGSALTLRAKAKNFTGGSGPAGGSGPSGSGLAEAVEYARARGVKTYCAVNAFARDRDFDNLDVYLRFLRSVNIDALIVSDPGVFYTARRIVPEIPIHISTQANTSNSHSVRFWHELGASRAILSRELSMAEIGAIRAPEGFELEVFVHGAMCVSISGRCLLSSWMCGRDSNRGECAHPCRYKYALMEETRPGEYLPVYEDEGGTYILNSKDLCMLEYIPELVSAGVTGFKIEGRMKSAYYAAAVVKAYREAIDGYFESPALYERNKQRYMEEIQKTESRGFTTGFYFSRPGPEAQVYQPCASPHSQGPSGKGTGSDFAAVALDYDAASGCALVEQRNKFWRGETLEIFSHSRPNREQVIATMTDEQGVQLENAPHPRQKIRIKVEGPVLPMDILRRNHKC